MIFWSPTLEKVEKWEPTGGWNSMFSDKDKIQLMNLFFFFKNKKGCKESKAEILANMVLFKQKHIGVIYSEEQEKIIHDLLQPVFSS